MKREIAKFLNFYYTQIHFLIPTTRFRATLLSFLHFLYITLLPIFEYGVVKSVVKCGPLKLWATYKYGHMEIWPKN